MAKQMVFLKYNFVFDAGSTWSHLSQFEEALADFFRGHDLEAQIIKTVSGQMGDTLMLIKRVKMAPKPKTIKEGKGIKVKVKKTPKMKKGGKPLPKGKDKKVKFSTKKGRRLKGASKSTQLGGRK